MFYSFVNNKYILSNKVVPNDIIVSIKFPNLSKHLFCLAAECSVLGCEHICVSTGEGKGQCLCGQGFELNNDKKTCQSKFSKYKWSYYSFYENISP